MGKLRVGCVLDNPAQSAIACDLIDKSRHSKSYSIDLLIIQSPRSRNKGFVKARMEQAFLVLLKNVERFLAGAGPGCSRASNTINIETVYLNPIPSRDRPGYKYSPEQLEQFKKSNLDILVCIGDENPSCEILNLCRLGAISLKFASNRAPGFWEVATREPTTHFVIRRATRDLPAGLVLFAGGFPTAPLFTWNLAKASVKANYHLHRLLEGFGESQELLEAVNNTPFCYPLDMEPTIGRLLSYVLKTCAYMGRKALRRIQGKSRRWGVAYQFVDDWKSAILCRSTIIRNPPNRFLADPFVVCKDGHHVCLVEDYDYATGKGKISAFKITKDSCTELGTALEENFHLSYPFVFEACGDLYMCPETSGANDLRLYKCIEFPLVWRLHKILKSDVSAADTSIFKSDGKWWMLANIDSPRLGEHCSELHLFYADTFDSTEWTPHRLNPIIVDPLRCRNGGLLVCGGDVYRVFQVPGFDMYGKSMGIAKITKLSEESYAEECLYSLPAKFFGELEGSHTYSFENGLLAVDFVKVDYRRR
jgi:hypothetical protein